MYLCLCFLLSTQASLQSLLIIILWWNGNHNLICCVTPHEFRLVFCILDCRYYVRDLSICFCNDSNPELFDNSYHPHEITFCICGRLFDTCIVNSLHLSVHLMSTGWILNNNRLHLSGFFSRWYFLRAKIPYMLKLKMESSYIFNIDCS